jgi:hypothetical protein
LTLKHTDKVVGKAHGSSATWLQTARDGRVHNFCRVGKGAQLFHLWQIVEEMK